MLKEKSNSIRKRVKEVTGISVRKPVCFSAEKQYNIGKLMNLIIDNMPVTRRPLLRKKAS